MVVVGGERLHCQRCVVLESEMSHCFHHRFIDTYIMVMIHSHVPQVMPYFESRIIYIYILYNYIYAHTRKEHASVVNTFGSSWLLPKGQISSMPRKVKASSQDKTGQNPPEAIISCVVQQKSQGDSSQRSAELLRHTWTIQIFMLCPRSGGTCLGQCQAFN